MFRGSEEGGSSTGRLSSFARRVLPTRVFRNPEDPETRKVEPKSHSPKLNLYDVPTEILLHVIDHLGSAERAAMALCNKKMLFKLGDASFRLNPKSPPLRQFLLGLERDDYERLHVENGLEFRTRPLFCASCVRMHPPELSWARPLGQNRPRGWQTMLRPDRRLSCCQYRTGLQNSHGIPGFTGLRLVMEASVHAAELDKRSRRYGLSGIELEASIELKARMRGLDYQDIRTIRLQRCAGAFLVAEYQAHHVVEKGQLVRYSTLIITPDLHALSIPLYPSDLLDALACSPLYSHCCAHITWQRAFPDLFNEGPDEDPTEDHFRIGTWFQYRLFGDSSPNFTCKTCRTMYRWRIQRSGRTLSLHTIKKLGSGKDESDPRWKAHQLPTFGAAYDKSPHCLAAAGDWARYGMAKMSKLVADR